MENCYEILGCDQSSSQDTLKQAYQALALKYHPDKLSTEQLSEAERAAAVDKFVRVDKAWKILSDSQSRKEFDARWTQRCQARNWPVQYEVENGDLDYDEDVEVFLYPCRCGGEYELTPTDVKYKMDYVMCSSCSFALKVNYTTDITETVQ